MEDEPDPAAPGASTAPSSTCLQQDAPLAEPDLDSTVPDLAVETEVGPDGLWVRLRGEADLANHETLRSELGRIRLEGAHAVHLVLVELTFCDLYAFRHLVAFAEQVTAAGAEISAHGACPTLKKMARVMQVVQDLHFV